MSFLKFLVTKKKISADNLIKALLRQQHDSPSLLECLADHPKCDNQQLLQLLIFAQDHNVDLKTAQEKNKLLDEGVFNQSLRQFTDKQTPIGKICADLGLINVGDYEALLGEYQLFKESSPATKVEKTAAPAPAPTPKLEESSSAEPEISEAALESLRELGILDESLLGTEKKS